MLIGQGWHNLFTLAICWFHTQHWCCNSLNSDPSGSPPGGGYCPMQPSGWTQKKPITMKQCKWGVQTKSHCASRWKRSSATRNQLWWQCWSRHQTRNRLHGLQAIPIAMQRCLTYGQDDFHHGAPLFHDRLTKVYTCHITQTPCCPQYWLLAHWNMEPFTSKSAAACHSPLHCLWGKTWTEHFPLQLQWQDWDRDNLSSCALTDQNWSNSLSWLLCYYPLHACHCCESVP